MMTYFKQTYFFQAGMRLICILLFIYMCAGCNNNHLAHKLVFSGYPELKLGLSTLNFQGSIPFNINGISEIMSFSAKEGYQFIEIRDGAATLAIEDCKALAELSKKYNLAVIYVIGINPLDTSFIQVFQKGLNNALMFPEPGILRTIISKSEFDVDVNKKGWSKDELTRLIRITDSCAQIANESGINLAVENMNEAFFGDSLTYFGLADFLTRTSSTSFLLDIGNLFRSTSRVKNDPEKVLKFLPTLDNRWLYTHLKTIQDGEVQPFLTDNPIPVGRIIDLMDKQKVLYAMLELAPDTNKQLCFDNHAKSIKFLKDKGLLKK